MTHKRSKHAFLYGKKHKINDKKYLKMRRDVFFNTPAALSKSHRKHGVHTTAQT